MGFATMTPVGLLRLGQTVVNAIAGNPDPMLTPAVYIYVYACFIVLGLSFAVTAWRTRDLQADLPSASPMSRSSLSLPSLTHR